MNDNILRTIIRFALIVVFLILLVFLSITLFKLIPKGINQLATASLSITGMSPDATTTMPVDRTPQAVATTTSGLNGSIVIGGQPEPIATPVKTNTVAKPVSTAKYYAPSTNYTYYPSVPRSTGRKNIKVSLVAVGIIDRNTGQFVSTNSFNTSDMVSVKYRISNDGDTDTGYWNMRVEMPAMNSGDQVRYLNNVSIPANSSYSVEARFDGINTTYNPTVRIYTDVNNTVAETNESDNTLIVPINNVVNNNYIYNGSNYNCYGNYSYNINCNNGNYYNNNNCNQFYNYNCNNSNSPANLLINSIQTGKTVSGSFNQQTSFVYGDRVTIRVVVQNTGNTFYNNWSARLNYYDSNGTYRTVTMDNQRAINSGETSILTFDVDSLPRGNTSFNVVLDSNNTVYETNEGDNTAGTSVYVY